VQVVAPALPAAAPGRCSEPILPSALQKLRGWDDVDEEIVEIRQEDEEEKSEGFVSVWKLFQLRTLRWQLISIIVLMGGQQLSGVNAVWGRPRGSGADGTVQAAAPRGPAVHTPPSP
jgi:hypothetical protein